MIVTRVAEGSGGVVKRRLRRGSLAGVMDRCSNDEPDDVSIRGGQAPGWLHIRSQVEELTRRHGWELSGHVLAESTSNIHAGPLQRQRRNTSGQDNGVDSVLIPCEARPLTDLNDQYRSLLHGIILNEPLLASQARPSRSGNCNLSKQNLNEPNIIALYNNLSIKMATGYCRHHNIFILSAQDDKIIPTLPAKSVADV